MQNLEKRILELEKAKPTDGGIALLVPDQNGVYPPPPPVCTTVIRVVGVKPQHGKD